MDLDVFLIIFEGPITFQSLAEEFQVWTTPSKTYITSWKIHHLKMYFLLNMGIFQCHVSFQGCPTFYLLFLNFVKWLG